MPKIPPLPTPEQTEAKPVTERLGINLFDLERVDTGMYQRLLAGRLDLRKESVVRLSDSKPDDSVVPFTCGTREAALVCDILRSENRREGDEPVRVYIFRAKAWTRLSGQVILTLPGDPESGQKARLNPDIFPSQVMYAPLLPPKAPTRLEL